MSNLTIKIPPREQGPVIETSKYEEMVNRMDFNEFCNYIRKNQGTTFEQICNDYTEDSECLKYLLNIWINSWTTFFQSGGRIIKNKNKYYCLSPRNPQSRLRNPVVNTLL
jgi:hypothetical protein